MVIGEGSGGRGKRLRKALEGKYDQRTLCKYEIWKEQIFFLMLRGVKERCNEDVQNLAVKLNFHF